jgi:hypothetical protein
LALDASAQGTIIVDNAIANNGVADLTAGNYYTGTYGLELFYAPEPAGGSSALTAFLSGINGLQGLAAYNAMVADRFTALTGGEFDNQTMSDGIIAFGQETFVNLPAGTVVLGLLAWTGSGTAAAATAGNPSGVHLGVLAFPQVSVNLFGAAEPPTPFDLHSGWNSVGQDLVMGPVPGPSVFALIGVGVGAVLAFRCPRRQRRRPPPGRSP